MAPGNPLRSTGKNQLEATMGFSPHVEPIWSDIITGKVKLDFEFLAAKILQSTLTRSFAKDPTPEKLDKCAKDLRELYSQNSDLPSAQKDLKKIFG
jgi:hypothetical protein